jgi:hypothetical protein
MVFDMRVHRNDAEQAGEGNRRIEFAPKEGTSASVSDGGTHWLGVQFMFPEPATIAATDWLALSGVHPPTGGLSGVWSLYLVGGKYRLAVRYQTNPDLPPSHDNTSRTDSDLGDVQAGKWDTLVLKFRMNSTGRDGFLQLWRNGTQVVNHVGQLGYAAYGAGYVQPAGLYNWEWGLGRGDYSRPERRMLVRGMIFGNDSPAVSEEGVRASLN